MIDFQLAKNIIIASHISGVYDVNRNETLANDDFSIVSKWAKSISDLNLQAIIFHNNFSQETCDAYQNESIRFVRITFDFNYNPNVYRYFLYNEFLKLYSSQFDNVFFTDVSDVVVLKNPFVQELFTENSMSVFCGDEPEILDNEWMYNHSEHLRNKISDYAIYEAKFKNHILLNCGIIGGTSTVMQLFIENLWAIHEKYNCDNKTLYTGDMGAFNYLVRTEYNDRIIHGSPVNTEFKKYFEDLSCWFKHK